MKPVWLAHYDEGVPGSIEYPEVPAYRPFLDSAAADPGATAVIYGSLSITYGELATASSGLAIALQHEEATASPVGIFLPNRPEIVTSFFGTLMSGARAVMLNPILAEPELEQMIIDTGLKTLITTPGNWERCSEVAIGSGVTLAIITGDAEDLAGGARVLGFEEAAVAEGSPDLEEVDPTRDVAVLIYTGGTTGIPKAVELTHYALVANALQMAAWVSIRPGRVGLAAIPIYHSFGLSTGLNASLFNGATIVLAEGQDTDALLDAIEANRPSLFVGVPAIFDSIVCHPRAETADLSSLRDCFVGAALVPPKVKARFEELTGGVLREGYGLTEAVTAQSANPLRGLEKPGSIGIPFPDVEFRIVDMETGTRELQKDQVGELTIKSPCLMKGYHNRPADTARALRDGWLFTSDIAWMDSDGYFYLIDRKKDIVIAGAFKAYPAEVEALLVTHPKIKEAAVLGTFDDISGHSLKAFIVLREGEEMTEDEVITFSHENLSDYKVPRSVEFVDSLPRSSMGKILRRELESE